MRRSRVAGSMLVGVSAFQFALAAGAPLGQLAYGGAHSGTVPTSYRATSAVAAAVYGGLAVVAFRGGRGRSWERHALRGASVLMAGGAVLNLASPSLPERLVWTPTTAALCLLLLQLARPEEPAGAGSAPAPA